MYEASAEGVVDHGLDHVQARHACSGVVWWCALWLRNRPTCKCVGSYRWERTEERGGDPLRPCSVLLRRCPSQCRAASLYFGESAAGAIFLNRT
jgi:hypothetical protein